MSQTFTDAVRSAALAKREHLQAQLHTSRSAVQPLATSKSNEHLEGLSDDRPTTPAPTEPEMNRMFAAQGQIELVRSWFTVTLSASGFTCTCAEFKNFHWCYHVRDAWRSLEPSRMKVIA